MSEDKHKNYLRDLGYLIKERALDAKTEKDKSMEEKLDFNRGYSMAYYSIVSLMKSQAIAFEIGETDICMDDIDPDKDLL